MSERSEDVLDASAVIALIEGEPGAESVARSIPHAAVCAVNVAEVAAYFMDAGMPRDDARSALERICAQFEVVDFGLQDAIEAGLLRGPTRSKGLSLADRACLALAARLGATARTADRAWKDLEVGVRIELIR